jgi:hypothetical protein
MKVLAVAPAYSLVEGIRLIRGVLMEFIEGKWKQTRDECRGGRDSQAGRCCSWLGGSLRSRGWQLPLES